MAYQGHFWRGQSCNTVSSEGDQHTSPSTLPGSSDGREIIEFSLNKEKVGSVVSWETCRI